MIAIYMNQQTSECKNKQTNENTLSAITASFCFVSTFYAHHKLGSLPQISTEYLEGI